MFRIMNLSHQLMDFSCNDSYGINILLGFRVCEYIESLQTISLPFLRNGTFRAFPVEGDSMPPYND